MDLFSIGFDMAGAGVIGFERNAQARIGIAATFSSGLALIWQGASYDSSTARLNGIACDGARHGCGVGSGVEEPPEGCHPLLRRGVRLAATLDMAVLPLNC